jgi:uncharacterized protein
MRRQIFPAFVFLSLAFFCCQEKNKSSARIATAVIDSASILTDVQEEDLLSIINSLEKDVGSQIVIMTVNSLSGQSIEQFSITAAEKLKIGRKKENDGILITVAMEEHKMRIEVGTGLEKIISDDVAGRIIREEMAPEFKNGKFYEGLRAATTRIKTMIEENRQLVGTPPYP